MWRLWFSGLLHHVVWWLDTSISEDCAASMVLQNTGMQPPYYTAQQPRKPQIAFSLP